MVWPKLRLNCIRNMLGISENLVRLHGDSGPEVKALLKKLKAVVTAVETPAQAFTAEVLRAPLDSLRDAMRKHEFKLVVTPDSFQLLLYLRVFVLVALQVLDGGLPLQVAAAIPVARPVRPLRQQRQIVPPTSQHNIPARAQRIQLPTNHQQVVVPARPQRQRRSAPVPRMVELKQEDDQQQPDVPVTPAKKSNPLKRVHAGSGGYSTPVKAAKPSKALLKSVKKEIAQCDYCSDALGVEQADKVKHFWKKHKEHVYQVSRPELVCTGVTYCDHVCSSEQARRIHEGKVHGQHPLDEKEVVGEFEKPNSKCPYCDFGIHRIGFLKSHMASCTMRDERPMLGCSTCPDEKFHYLVDFIVHLKQNNGKNHGKPVLLTYN